MNDALLTGASRLPVTLGRFTGSLVAALAGHNLWSVSARYQHLAGCAFMDFPIGAPSYKDGRFYPVMIMAGGAHLLAISAAFIAAFGPFIYG